MEETYTYRRGQILKLRKRPDQFVVRALPDEVDRKLGIDDAEQVSSASSMVAVRPGDLDPLMARARVEVAPAHHLYEIADTAEEFLITDRIIVRFREGATPEDAD